MSELVPASPGFEQAYQRISAILAEARRRAYQAINSAMVVAYWEIGRTIVEEEQQGQERAEYGRRLVEELAKRLKFDFGKGFERSNLWNMRSFTRHIQLSTHCVENCRGPTIGFSFASQSQTREAFTKTRR